MKSIISKTTNLYNKLSHSWDIKIRKLIPGYETMHELAQSLLENSLPESANILISGVGTGYEATSYAIT